MFWRTFIVWASPKFNFIRGLSWFICGLALGIRSLALGVSLLAVSLVLNFFAARLELTANRYRVLPAEKPVKTHSKASQAPSLDMSELLRAALASANNNPPE